jgi:hypothetical protein
MGRSPAQPGAEQQYADLPWYTKLSFGWCVRTGAKREASGLRAISPSVSVGMRHLPR